MISLDHDKHDLVKKQLQRLEWCGTEGGHCPECGGVRPKDKIDTSVPPLDVSKDGVARFPTKSGVFHPDPHEGHGRSCSLASAIAIMSSKDRIVVYCTSGDPPGYEASK